MRLTWLLRITIVFTLLVILMGAYTRLSDAGLGCPDWPGCYGHIKVPTHDHEISHAQTLFPDHDIHPEKAWLEMIHRYIAGALGILVLLILILCLKTSQAPKKAALCHSVTHHLSGGVGDVDCDDEINADCRDVPFNWRL